MNETKPDDYVYTTIDAIDEVSYGGKRKKKHKPSSGKFKWNKLNGFQKFWLISVVIQKFFIVLISIPTLDFGFAFLMMIIILNVNCLIYVVGIIIAKGLSRFKG